MRKRPFGYPEQALRRELARRRSEHQLALAPRRSELTRLRQACAELSRYHEMLRLESALFEEEQRQLLRELAEISGKPWAPESAAPPPPETGLESLRQTLRHYRALHIDISASVMALIAPFLEQKEEAAWRSGGSGFGAQ